MYMSVSMLINSSFLVATPCLAIIVLTMHMKDKKGRCRLLKLSARRKQCVRTANCGQRAIQKSHIILYQLYYHVIAVDRCGLDICITISKYDVMCSVIIWLLTISIEKYPSLYFRSYSRWFCTYIFDHMCV